MYSVQEQGTFWFEQTQCLTSFLVLDIKTFLMKTKKLYSGDVCRRLLKIYMWSYNLVRKRTPSLFIIICADQYLLFRYGLFDEIRMDHGQEFCLCLFVQELYKEYKFDKRRPLWRQTPRGYSGFQVTGRCEGGHKLNTKKFLGLEAKPKNIPWTKMMVTQGVSGMVHGGEK